MAMKTAAKPVTKTRRAVARACIQTHKAKRMYETLSYLPPLSNEEVKAQLAYFLRKNLTPCIEFEDEDKSFAVENPAYGPGFYYNRYWKMYKLPLFGCTDGDQVLDEINNCKKEWPGCFIRVVGFDAARQVQIASFIVHKPVE